MMVLRCPRLMMLTGLLSLFGFSGDIIADSIADLRGEQCVSQSSQSNSAHQKCSCPVQNGAVVLSNSVVNVSGGREASIHFVVSDQSVPTALPTSIDHPPQLA